MSTNRTLYEYWDDPNELVDRLWLLIVSRDAGHSGHGNEIHSIIEELRDRSCMKDSAKAKIDATLR